MGTDRRSFLKLSVAAGGAVGLGLVPGSMSAGQARRSTPRALRILILGGTGFIGPHQVRYALARGHTVTLFNRG
ncbi:MAG: twin-arginine translocation signal domain-containing protein, partial [Gemmatimonadota bacterium]